MTAQRGTGWIGAALRVRAGEGGRVVLSGLFFFLLLFGYFLIRPVREAMGVQRSMSDLRWLFITTCVISLVVTLLFGGLVARTDRSRFIPLATRCVIVCLGVFALLLLLGGDGVRVWSGYVFYVWLSIINLFMVSVFWAFMNDVWTREQGRRLFPAIAVGGTLGALLGSMFAWQLSGQIGYVAQLGLAAVMFECTVWVMRRIDALSCRSGQDAAAGESGDGARGGVGGSWVDGARAIVCSRYLMGIGLYIVLMALSSTLIYFTQGKLVIDASDELNERVALFAQLDMWTQAATLLTQLFITGRLMRWIGVGGTLAVLPIVTALGFGVLAWVSSIDGIEGWQVFGVFAAFTAIHRATRYAIARPARETLFGVLSTEEKYKAKPIVDVFLYRGGDVAGTGVDAALSLVGVGLVGMAVVVGPFAAIWAGVGLWLAWEQGTRGGVGGMTDDSVERGLGRDDERTDQEPRAQAGAIPGGVSR